ncbi:unnamed protein product [Tenebrio molitor]|nr:unnamed protein product [Tenebrio molitor]
MEKSTLFFPNFPVFRATFPVFLYIKISFGLLRTFKKNSHIVPAVPIEKIFPEFFNFLGNFSNFFSLKT